MSKENKDKTIEKLIKFLSNINEKFSNTEVRILKVLIEKGPSTPRQIYEYLNKEVKLLTVYRLLSRLCSEDKIIHSQRIMFPYKRNSDRVKYRIDYFVKFRYERFLNKQIPDLVITDNIEFLLNEINRFRFNIIEQNFSTELKTELIKKLEEMKQIVNIHKTK